MNDIIYLLKGSGTIYIYIDIYNIYKCIHFTLITSCFLVFIKFIDCTFKLKRVFKSLPLTTDEYVTNIIQLN